MQIKSVRARKTAQAGKMKCYARALPKSERPANAMGNSDVRIGNALIYILYVTHTRTVMAEKMKKSVELNVLKDVTAME